MRLGIWQLDRLEQRRTYNALLQQRLAMPPEPLDGVVGAGKPPTAAAVAYRRVEVRGTYDAEHEVVLFGRSLNGDPGNHVLTPLVAADGRAVIVDRGWVPGGLGPPPGEAAPPSGTVRVTGVLFPSEEGGSFDPASGTISRVDVAAIGRRLPYDVEPVYLWLLAQQPKSPSSLPVPPPLPELTDGPHLSYAVQWFSFAAVALIGYGVLIRRELRATRAAGW